MTTITLRHELLDPRSLDRDLGRLFREGRERAGLTAEVVSERAGFRLSYYGMVERGLRRPSWEALQRFFTVLRLEPAERRQALRLYGLAHLADTVRRLHPQIRRALGPLRFR